jgi:predicted CoA-binding protein
MSEATIPKTAAAVPAHAPGSPDQADACPLPNAAQAPDDDLLVEALATAKTIAVVGASPNEARTSHQIAVWLIEETPLQVFLVNPAAGDTEILGHAFYDSIADLPTPPDIVDVFRRREYVEPITDDAIAADARVLWLQLGVVNDDAIQRARDAGLLGVQNRCIKVEYARLSDRIDAAREERQS